VVFQGVNVLGGTVFEVAENLRRYIELIIGRPEIDLWDIIFTPKGLKPRRIPIEFLDEMYVIVLSVALLNLKQEVKASNHGHRLTIGFTQR